MKNLWPIEATFVVFGVAVGFLLCLLGESSGFGRALVTVILAATALYCVIGAAAAILNPKQQKTEGQ